MDILIYFGIGIILSFIVIFFVFYDKFSGYRVQIKDTGEDWH